MNEEYYINNMLKIMNDMKKLIESRNKIDDQTIRFYIAWMETILNAAP
jgi:hemerythrin-like domain-containing protein